MATTDLRTGLAERIRGKSDEEILSLVQSVGGPAEVLDTIFEALTAGIEGMSERAEIGWHVDAEGTAYDYTLLLGEGEARMRRGAADDARIDIYLPLAELLRIAAGLTSPPRAAMRGVMRFQGDVMFAFRVNKILSFDNR